MRHCDSGSRLDSRCIDQAVCSSGRPPCGVYHRFLRTLTKLLKCMPSRIHTPHWVPEVDNYNRIYGNMDELPGLAECHGGVDLGEIQGMEGHHTISA